jgi:cytochrome c biogenesis protein
VVDQTLTSAPARDQPPEPRPPALKPLELARWAWRQLTSMRTALVLLFLLALAAVPGSLVPQRSIDAARAAQFAAQHPHLAPWYDRFSLF